MIKRLIIFLLIAAFLMSASGCVDGFLFGPPDPIIIIGSEEPDDNS